MPFPPGKADDAWTKRAFRNCKRNITSMRDPALYRHIDRYKRAVRDIGRVLRSLAGRYSGRTGKLRTQRAVSFEEQRPPTAAERPELNPFYPYFKSRLRGSSAKRSPRIGISMNYLSQALSAFSMIGFIRREFPRLKVILGGGLITSWLKNPVEKPFLRTDRSSRGGARRISAPLTSRSGCDRRKNTEAGLSCPAAESLSFPRFYPALQRLDRVLLEQVCVLS